MKRLSSLLPPPPPSQDIQNLLFQAGESLRTAVVVAIEYYFGYAEKMPSLDTEERMMARSLAENVAAVMYSVDQDDGMPMAYATRRRVLDASKELGNIARQMRGSRSGMSPFAGQIFDACIQFNLALVNFLRFEEELRRCGIYKYDRLSLAAIKAEVQDFVDRHAKMLNDEWPPPPPSLQNIVCLAGELLRESLILAMLDYFIAAWNLYDVDTEERMKLRRLAERVEDVMYSFVQLDAPSASSTAIPDLIRETANFSFLGLSPSAIAPVIACHSFNEALRQFLLFKAELRRFGIKCDCDLSLASIKYTVQDNVDEHAEMLADLACKDCEYLRDALINAINDYFTAAEKMPSLDTEECIALRSIAESVENVMHSFAREDALHTFDASSGLQRDIENFEVRTDSSMRELKIILAAASFDLALMRFRFFVQKLSQRGIKCDCDLSLAAIKAEGQGRLDAYAKMLNDEWPDRLPF